MHSIDKKLIKNKVGTFEFNGKKHNVFKPTLNQIITHTVESEEYNNNLKTLLDGGEDNSLAIIKLRYNWLIREIEIFVPSMEKEEIGELEEDMREEILSIISSNNEPKIEKGSKKKGA